MHPPDQFIEPVVAGGALRLQIESMPTALIDMKLGRRSCLPPGVIELDRIVRRELVVRGSGNEGRRRIGGNRRAKPAIDQADKIGP